MKLANEMRLNAILECSKSFTDYMKTIHENWDKSDQDFEIDECLRMMMDTQFTMRMVIKRLLRDRPF